MSARDLRHDEAVNELTRAKCRELERAILTGAPAASGLGNLVLDKLAEPDQIAILARVALSSAVADAGLFLRRLVVDVLHAEAEKDVVAGISGTARHDPG